MSGQIPGPRRKAEGHLELVTPPVHNGTDAAEIVVTRSDESGDPFLDFDSETDPRSSTARTVLAATDADAATAKRGASAAARTTGTKGTPVATARPHGPRRASRVLLFVLGALLIAGAAAALTYLYLDKWRAAAPTVPPVAAVPPAPPRPDATVQVISQPEGARVFIDGAASGVTPLKASLTAGSHVIEVEHLDARRSMPVTLEPGATSSHYFDFTAASAPAGATTGRLEVTSDPPGATVTIDGTSRGVTPLVIAAMPPGSHRVLIASRDQSATRTVTVTAGQTSTLSVPLARPVATTNGVVSVQSPVELDVFLEGTKVGSSLTSVRLPPGRHTLDLLNASLEFRTTITVDVTAGGTANAVVPVPKGKLSINATPWADILLDGKPVGQTPLANLDVPIGPHEVIWRHPQLGERRETVIVKAQTPMRVGKDFNR
jgi:hypothetical protein